MLQLVQRFPTQLAEADALGHALRLDAKYRPIRSVHVLGMGGSAFSGALLQNYGHSFLDVPLQVHRDYVIPRCIDANALCLVCSYSGNTEETLSAAGFALDQGAMLVAFSSGGKLQALAAEQDFAHVALPPGLPPRAAFGYSFILQLHVLQRLRLLDDFSAELVDALEVIQDFDAHEEARALAQAITGRLPVIYCGAALEATSIRLQQQINENAKQLCLRHIVPEMNHNELVGWELPEAIIAQASVLLLRSSFEYPRNSVRLEICKDLWRKKGAPIHEIHGRGKYKLAHLLYLIHYCDWFSVYLAEANGVEATPVRVIDYLKTELEKIQ